MVAPSPPSPFFVRWSDRIADAGRSGPVVDLACGRGRHSLAAAAAGAHVVGVDRNAAFLRQLRERAAARGLRLETLRTDLESGHGIPLKPGSCGAILVFRFLFRSLAAAIEEALRPGGLLLYETFTIGQRELPGGPDNPDFLLRPGELPRLFANLEILESGEGISDGDRPDALARLAARRR